MTRRPDIELPDDVAAYVETHPDEVARLASRARRDELRAELAERPRLGEQGRARLREHLRSSRLDRPAVATGRRYLEGLYPERAQ